MNFTKEDWQEWAGRPMTKAFMKEIIRRRQYKFEEMATFTNPESISKDYFFTKGFCEGIVDVLDLISDLKREKE